MGEARLALEAALRHPELTPNDPRHEGPLVSVVIVTRDGLHHLRRLFEGLRRRTHYRNFEVVVIDNASTDGTREWLDRDHGFAIETIDNPENRSFSTSNNQALGVARGELTLVLNNDVEPMHADWLSLLVAELTDNDDVAAVGPLLVYPEREAVPGEPFSFPDLSVQHAGVGFEIKGGRVRARNIGAGDDPRAPWFRTRREVAALSAACLLAPTVRLRELGGFDPAYFYGSEDWDLSLRLGGTGRLVLVGRSVLYHHEYGTQNTFERAERADYRRRNHLVFNGVWGSEIRRGLLLEHLGAKGCLAGGAPPTFAVVEPASPVVSWLASQLETLGWEPDDGAGPDTILRLRSDGATEEAQRDAALDVVITRSALDTPPSDGTTAVVGLDGYQPRSITTPTVAAGRPRGEGSRSKQSRLGDVLDALRTLVKRPRFAIRNCAPNPKAAVRWGDTYFAQSLANALAMEGFEARIFTAVEWEQPRAYPFDVVIHLRGLRRYAPLEGSTNVMWIISHPDDVDDDELAETDLVLVASSTFAETLRGRTSTPVHVFHQATDLTRFHPVRHDLRQASSGIVVAQNARWPYRRAPRWLMELGWDFSLYGANWSKFPEARYLKAPWVSNDELSDIYATADIVVADQWDHMAREGFVPNRLFDVAAAGGFVISDDGPGVREIFGDLVPTYSSRAELNELLHRYLNDPAERDRLARQAMAYVRSEHSFGARVASLLDLLDVGCGRRSSGANEQRPSRSVAG